MMVIRLIDASILDLHFEQAARHSDARMLDLPFGYSQICEC
jgi:hypothetical protein